MHCKVDGSRKERKETDKLHVDRLQLVRNQLLASWKNSPQVSECGCKARFRVSINLASTTGCWAALNQEMKLGIASRNPTKGE